VGLIFKRWIDLPVFVLANVTVDIEVLLYNHWPFHRYAHTLLIGAGVGIIWAIGAYFLRGWFRSFMNKMRLSYESNFKKVLLSAILGVWFHVLIDAFYHYDVNIFWPSRAKPLYRLISQQQVSFFCLVFWALAIALYLFILYRNRKRDADDSQRPK